MAILAFVAVVGAVGVIIAALLGASGSGLGMYGEIFVVNRDGRGLRQLTHDQRLHPYAWSPDGRWIAATTRSVSANGGIDVPGPLELLESSGKQARDIRLGGFGSAPVWRSNKSLELLLTASHSNVKSTRIVEVGLSGRVRLGAWIGPIGAAAWAPDGDALAIVPCHETRGRYIIEVLSRSGHAARYLDRLPGALAAAESCEDPEAGEPVLVWAPDGRSLFVGLSTGLWRLPLDGAAPRRIYRGALDSEPVVSPDGQELVIELSVTRGHETGPLLYLLPSTGGHPRLLTAKFASEPAWSPDGRTIAFIPRSGETINTVPAVGGTARTLMRFPEEGTAICCLSWSGRQLAFEASAEPPET